MIDSESVKEHTDGYRLCLRRPVKNPAASFCKQRSLYQTAFELTEMVLVTFFS